MGYLSRTGGGGVGGAEAGDAVRDTVRLAIWIALTPGLELS